MQSVFQFLSYTNNATSTNVDSHSELVIRSKIVTDEECCQNLWRNFERPSFDFFVS